MKAETESCNDKAKKVRGLGLRLSDKHWPSFERLENLTVSTKQKVSRKGLRLANSISNNLTAQHNTQGLGYEGEISRWSSDSSESDYEKSNIEKESEAEEHFEETMEQKLERHRQFFRSKPLMRCLKEEEACYRDWMDGLFYDNLCHEVQHKVDETRRQDVARAYWMDVREKLAVDDSEISDTSDLMPEPDHEHEVTVIPSNFGSMSWKLPGWKRPLNTCPSSGKDVDLQKIRDFWTERKQKRLGRAMTFGKIEGQELGNISFREDLGRAANV
ncbi:hypothetical protein BKA64DRAFT_707514 [Cadophora sp. MPI-SDFR-AT-0126]|nr:hypothetical protein BKA64DRAFT_707514 [Leotiomycetes sp. MPI-SDFR-AT-0126]